MKLKPFLLLAISLLLCMANPLCAEAQPQSDGYVHDVIQLEEIPIKEYSTGFTTSIIEQMQAFNVSTLLYTVDVYSTTDSKTGIKTRQYISLKKSENHGFITKKSLGFAKKVTITWSTSTSNPGSQTRIGIIIYGKPQAYSNIDEAYNTIQQGEEIGFIETNKTETTQTVTLSTDFKYIAIVPTGNNVAITSLDIAWQQTEYERDVTAGNLNTLCLPYNATIPAGMQVFEVLGKTMDGTTPKSIDFVPVNEIVAGIPYVFITDSNKLHLDLTSEQAVSTANHHNGLYGTFERYPFANDANHSDQYYIINSNNEIQAASKQSGVNANRAFIKMDEVPDLATIQSLPSHRLVLTDNGFSIIDEATSIGHVTTTNNAAKKEIVDLAGRTRPVSSSLPKGIYISNGKKIIK